MEKDRGTKIIAIVALLVAIVGVSLGFASFSNNLTISAEANVTPLNSLKVLFTSTKNATDYAGSNIVITKLPAEDVSEYTSFTAGTPTINNSVVTAPTITGLNADFVKPGESVKYTFYAYNDSTYAAYLTSIAFGNKSCTPADNSLVQSACDEIDISVKVGGGDGEPTAVTRSQATDGTGTVSGHSLASKAFETIEVTITYADLSEGAGNTDLNDGFHVDFSDIILTYSSTAS